VFYKAKVVPFSKTFGMYGIQTLCIITNIIHLIATVQYEYKDVCGCSQDCCVRKTLMNVMYFLVSTMQHVLMALPTTAVIVLRATLGDYVKKNHLILALVNPATMMLPALLVVLITGEIRTIQLISLKPITLTS
jgi:hypothetical protein